MKYSKLFMEKFGNIVLQRQDQHWLFKTIKYWFDRRYSKMVNLQKWLKTVIASNNYTIPAALQTTQLTNDQLIIKILQWVNQNITYKSDLNIWGTVEKWQTPAETLRLRTGDCEDGAILILALARSLGIPAYQIRIICGEVSVNQYQPFTGHAWIEYTSDGNGEQYFIDWCFYCDYTIIEDRKPAVLLNRYKTIWWAVNDQRGYGDFSIPPR